MTRTLILLLTGFLSLATVAAADSPVQIKVALEEAGAEVSPLALTGFNYGTTMQVAAYLSEFEALDVRALRYPHGEIGDERLLTDDDLRALETNWELLGRPHLTVVLNLLTGTPEDAAETVRRFQRFGIPVALWEVGNEPDLYAHPGKRNDPTWTPKRYCDSFRAYAQAVRQVDPTARLAGPSVSGASDVAPAFLKQVVRLCGDALDALSFHLYPTAGEYTDEAALATSESASELISLYRSWFQNPETNPLGHERDIPLAVTEFSLSSSVSFRHTEDMVAAVWLADVLGRLATEGVEASHYFALQGLGGHGLIDSGGWVRPTYYVYEMLAGFAGEVVPVVVNPPVVDAYAVRSEDRLRVLLVNRSSADVEAVLEGLELAEASGLELKILTKKTFEDYLGGVAYRTSTQAAHERIAVPARGVVVVTAAFH